MDGRKVNVLGWYGKSNVGDESYKLAFPLLFPSATFTFSDAPKDWLSADTTILGGGDVVNVDSLAALRAANGRRFIMSASLSHDIPREAFDGIEMILVRDHDSFERGKALQLPIHLCPDFATILSPNRERGRSILKKWFSDSGGNLYENVVVVVLNGYLCNREVGNRKSVDFEKLCFDIADLTDRVGASFVFMPFGCAFPWDDRVANSWCAMKAKWWKKNVLIYNPVEAQTALDVIGAAKATISTRLHSSIFSIAAGTPFIDLLHNHKNSNLLRLIEQPSWGMPINSFDWQECRDRLNEIIDSPQSRVAVESVREKQLIELKRVVSYVRLGR